MDIIRCPKCHNEVSASEDVCPYCGVQLKPPPVPIPGSYTQPPYMQKNAKRDSKPMYMQKKPVYMQKKVKQAKKSNPILGWALGWALCGCLLPVILMFGSCAMIGLIGGSSTNSSNKAKSPSKPRAPYVPSNSGWDASVREVERYLERNLKDPDSFDAIEWSTVVKHPSIKDAYMVRCRYRAKNSFGGYVISNQIFTISKVGQEYVVTDMVEL